MTLDGTLITIDGRPALRFERRYRQPIDRVWRAVTDPDEMARWFPSDVIGERSPGAPLRFDDARQQEEADAAGDARRADGPEWTGRVIAVDPPTVFSFTWGSEVLRFELHPDDDGGTRLVFTQLLSHRSVAARNGAGWHGCLAALDDLLGEPALAAEAAEDDERVYEAFVVAMGPEPGVASADGSRTWELGHHVGPERVRDAVSDPEEVEVWAGSKHGMKGAARVDDVVHWDIRTAGDGSLIRVTVAGAASDADLAATWHALLVQLDMYLAADVVLPVEPVLFTAAYSTGRAQDQ
jgi:uncharacterized protein YndB with AHSA1/START domain